MTARFTDLDPAQQAGILCNDPQFQHFAATRCGAPTEQFSTAAAAQFLRECCRINSRRELASNPQARERLARLRTEFDAWAGKIAPQR